MLIRLKFQNPRTRTQTPNVQTLDDLNPEIQMLCRYPTDRPLMGYLQSVASGEFLGALKMSGMVKLGMYGLVRGPDQLGSSRSRHSDN